MDYKSYQTNMPSHRTYLRSSQSRIYSIYETDWEFEYADVKHMKAKVICDSLKATF